MRYFKSFLIASSLVATLGFGQAMNKSCKPKPDCCPEMPKLQICPAYSAPANVNLACKRDVWVDGSFIYWQVAGENLELGINDHNAGSDDEDASVTPMLGNVVNMDFKFKPGFQVGLGVDFGCDNWDGYAEYTYFRSKDTVSQAAYTAGQVHSFWVSPGILLDESAPNFLRGAAKWRADFDFVDATVGRWYYSGKKLTFHPFFGLRAAFIRQRYGTTFVDSFGTVSMTHDKTHSWGVGPRTGVDGNWSIGRGFRFYGNGAADVLYTSYKIASTQTGVAAEEAGTKFIDVTQDTIGYLRTHIDLELGAGWDKYFACNKWHFDLSAGYGFQVFFDQIMFRKWLDDIDIAKSIMPMGDLFIQGLTVKAKLDF